MIWKWIFHITFTELLCPIFLTLTFLDLVFPQMKEPHDSVCERLHNVLVKVKETTNIMSNLFKKVWELNL